MEDLALALDFAPGALGARPLFRHLYDRHVRTVASPEAETLSDHVVVVGYGHAGRCVADVLARLSVPCLVVERDLAAAEEAEAAGLCVLQGDAANSTILAKILPLSNPVMGELEEGRIHIKDLDSGLVVTVFLTDEGLIRSLSI